MTDTAVSRPDPSGLIGLAPEDIITILGLQPHPEGGHYVETYRHVGDQGNRGACTCIYFLLREGERSHWHRVTDAVEIWHWYAGAPLRLSLSDDAKTVRSQVLGTDLPAGQRLHGVVEAGVWQAAESLGAWTLVGCTVAPAFDFAGFELAAPDWQPG